MQREVTRSPIQLLVLWGGISVGFICAALLSDLITQRLGIFTLTYEYI